jgi:hypothetical protein
MVRPRAEVPKIVYLATPLRCFMDFTPPFSKVKEKQSLYTPWRRLGGELLLIHDLGTRWG